MSFCYIYNNLFFCIFLKKNCSPGSETAQNVLADTLKTKHMEARVHGYSDRGNTVKKSKIRGVSEREKWF